MKFITAVAVAMFTLTLTSLSHAIPETKPPVDSKSREEGLKVKKAEGKNAYDLAEIFAKSAALQDKIISVRGQVVKVSASIMNRNWIHIKDGTGKNGANQLVVTSKDKPNVGDVVTCTGVLHNNVDFGSGYKYAIIMENAVVK